MSQIDLSEKFPNLRPINSVPSLGTINGIGMMMYGDRDRDRETGTYIKTHCFTVLFIPVLALGAYRVADAPGGGWYFVGKEPLSPLAKGWGVALVLGIAAAIGIGYWNSVYNTDDARAGRAIARAEQLVDDGEFVEAAGILEPIAVGNTDKKHDAQRALRDLLAKAVAGDDREQARGVLDKALALQQPGRVDWGDAVFEAGMTLAESAAGDNPVFAFDVLESIDDVAPEEPPAKLAELRRSLLTQLVKAYPGKLEYAAALAVIVDADESLDIEARQARCEELLEPHEDQLAATEGARILGRIRVAQDRFEDAYALLHPYCEERLDGLRTAEQGFEAAMNDCRERAIQNLQSGNVPPDVRRRLEMAGDDEDETGEIIGEWFASVMKDDSGMQAAQRNIVRAATVVPVALDLGVVLLQRSQNAATPEERTADLERAEETFLAIRGVAGDDAGFRIHLGQVKYWLGKQDEGHEIFDALLAESDRNFVTLVGVGRIYRELGDQQRARKLLEEAYEGAADDDERYLAASLRAISGPDLDDRISWLKKGDPTNFEVRATLADSLGDKAAEDGRDEKAKRHYHEALAIYDEQPEGDSVLNNSALVLMSLFALSEDPQHLRDAVGRMEKALRLNPSNAILTWNVGSARMRLAVLDIVGDRAGIASHWTSPQGVLFLADDAEAAEAWRQRIRRNATMKAGVANYEKAVLLAPNRPELYETLARYHHLVQDEAGTKSVLERARAASLDTADSDANTLAYRDGSDDAETTESTRQAIARIDGQLAEARRLGGVSQAVAAVAKMSGLVRLSRLEKVDADEVVALADEAHEAAPSYATRHARIQALLFRANESLQAENAGYARFVAGCERTLDDEQMLAFAAVHDETLRPAVLGHADVAQALEEAMELADRDPDQHRTTYWALLSVSDPAAAERTAEILREDRIGRTLNAILAITSPLDVPTSEYWFLRLEGKEAEADVLLKAAAARGAQLPKALGLAP